MERITSIDFFLHQITENQEKKPMPTKSTARGYPGCPRSGQDHTYQRRRSRPAGLESPWRAGSWIAQQVNGVAARIGDGGRRWRGRRIRWVDRGGELGGWMQEVSSVGRRRQRAGWVAEGGELSGRVRNLRISPEACDSSKELTRRLLTRRQARWLEKRGGREGWGDGPRCGGGSTHTGAHQPHRRTPHHRRLDGSHQTRGTRRREQC
jgi:hypothetical protein